MAQLHEPGQPRLAGVPGARAGRAGLLLLHLQGQVDVGAVPRRLVVHVHVLEESQAEDVALRAHERGAPEGVARIDGRLPADHVLLRSGVPRDRQIRDAGAGTLLDLEGDVHDGIPVGHLGLDGEEKVPLLLVERVRVLQGFLDLRLVVDGAGLRHRREGERRRGHGRVVGPTDAPEPVARPLAQKDMEGHALSVGQVHRDDRIHVGVLVSPRAHVQPELRLVLLQMLGLVHAALEKSRLPALHGLRELLLAQGLVAMDDDVPDLDLGALLHVEHDPDRPGSDRLAPRHDPGVSVAFGSVRLLDLSGVQLQRPRVEQLPLGGGELLLERLLLDLLHAVEHDLLDARPLGHVDRERDPSRRRRVAHRDVGEEPGRVEAPDAASNLLRVVGHPRRDAERAHHDEGVHVDESASRDAPDDGAYGLPAERRIRRRNGERVGLEPGWRCRRSRKGARPLRERARDQAENEKCRGRHREREPGGGAVTSGWFGAVPQEAKINSSPRRETNTSLPSFS